MLDINGFSKEVALVQDALVFPSVAHNAKSYLHGVQGKNYEGDPFWFSYNEKSKPLVDLPLRGRTFGGSPKYIPGKYFLLAAKHLS